MTRTINYPGILADLTETNAGNWVAHDGPESRVGTDLWYRNTETQQTAYINLDQGFLTIEVDGERYFCDELCEVPNVDQHVVDSE